MNINFEEITIIKRKNDWALCLGSDVLMDPSGKFEIAHENESFLIAIVEELQSFGALQLAKEGHIVPQYFGLLNMFYVELGHDCKQTNLDNLHEFIFQDVTFLKVSKNTSKSGDWQSFQEPIDQMSANSPVLKFLKILAPNNIEDVHLIAEMNEFDQYGLFWLTDDIIAMAKGTDDECYVASELSAQLALYKKSTLDIRNAVRYCDQNGEEDRLGCDMSLIEGLRDRNMERLKQTGFYAKLLSFLENISPEESVGLSVLLSFNGGTDTTKEIHMGRRTEVNCLHFLPSLAYVVGHLSAAQYATVVMSNRKFRHGVYEGVDRDEYHVQFKQRLEQAAIITNYIQMTKSKMTLLVEGGETLYCEFKESLSLDVRRTEKDKSYTPVKEEKIETSSLKTLVGFLNTKGGTLLVGVSDSKIILGIDNEIEELHMSLDKFLLYFKDLVANRLAKSIYANLEVTTSIVDSSTVLRIDAKPSSEPVFLQPGNVFYVRTSASTEQLAGGDMWRYQKDHFQ